MLPLPNSFRFLKRLNVQMTQAERQSVERVLGTARFALSLLSLLAVYLDPTDPTTYASLAYILLTCWMLYSTFVLVWLRYHDASPGVIRFLHAIDVLWPPVITLFTQGPNSPFFVFFVAALIGAGFRWGFPEALMTAVVGIGLLESQALLVGDEPAQIQLLLNGQFELNRLIIRSSYLLMVGFLIGYLAEIEKERRAESAVINRVLSQARAEQSLAPTMQAAITEFTRLFEAKRAFLVLENLEIDRVFLWQTAPSRADGRPYYRELPSQEVERNLLRSEPRTFFARKRKHSVQFKAIDQGDFVQEHRNDLPSFAFYTEQANSVLSSAIEFGHEWAGRLVLIDARVGFRAERELRFAEGLLRSIAPAIYSVYLVRRLRGRTGAMERARVARELHDGAIQSLISVEMQLDVLRRGAEREASPMAGDLRHVQSLLQSEVLNLRELMQQLRPVDMGPQQFLDFLADTVDRFRRDTGISASFVSDLQDVELSPHACREMARILQEALVNVRKHSGADEVLVRFAGENGAWKLVVDDNGRGFDFSGRLTLREMNASRKGPMVIKERVRTIGGDFFIDSTPGRGARLEVTLPKKGHLQHG